MNQMNTKTDEELMLEYKLGSLNSLEELFNRYQTRILNYAYRLMFNRADAEDVVGETFYVVTNRKYDYRPEAKFSTWLYRIAHNFCVTKLRKKEKFVFLWFKKSFDGDEYEQIDLPDNKPLVTADLQEAQAKVLVEKAVARLPEKLREALVLREYQGLNYQEIAGILDCSLAKVKVLIFRARERLKNELLPLKGEL
jgi:RNA polymerase sigma-70 factor, ECF subfamily